MSTSAGPNIIEDGLVLLLDTANEKSYPYHPDKMDHGISDWYCFDSGTARCAIVYPNTKVFQKDTSGSITTIVDAQNEGKYDITVTAGYKYWSDKAFYFHINDGQERLAPLTMAGKYFIQYSNRNAPQVFRFYSPYANATVTYYNDPTGGINGTSSGTVSVSKGTMEELSIGDTGWVYIKSDYDVLATVTGTGADKNILSPASNIVYTRRNGQSATIYGSAPSTNSTYVVSDSNLCMTQAIADGAGGDFEQGLGSEHLSDRYAYADVLSDYQVVAPNDNYIVVSYWDGAQWQIWDTHDLTGSELSPDAAFRDGTTGAGSEGSIISGAATNMQSGATLWKWEGTNKFLVVINDASDDETALLGWMSDNYERKSSNEDLTWYDISGNSNNGQIFGDFTFNRSTKVLHSNGVTGSYIDIPSPNLTSSDFTVISATRYAGSSPRGRIVSGRLNNWILGHWGSQAEKYYAVGWVTSSGGGPNDELWRIHAGTGNISSDQYSFFSNKNKLVTNSAGGSAGPNGFSIGRYGPGNSEYSNCDVGFLAVYNRVLSDSEIQQIFNALRSRYEL
jgi:hypothetical protein